MESKPRGRGMSAGLSRAAVVDAATDVAESVGLSRTTLRAVAQKLGVTPMAIYNHIGSSEELLDAMADRFIAQVLEGLPAADSPLSTVRTMAHALLRAGIEHPGLLTSVVGHIPDQIPSSQLDFCDRMLEQLVAAGASQRQAHDAYTAIVSLCLGMAVGTANLRAAHRTPLAERLERHQVHYGASQVADYLSEPHPSEQFLDRQLDLLLDPSRFSSAPK